MTCADARHILLADTRWLHLCGTTRAHPEVPEGEGWSDAPSSSWAAVTESPGPRMGIPWVRVCSGMLARLSDAAARHAGAEELRAMSERGAE